MALPFFLYYKLPMFHIKLNSTQHPPSNYYVETPAHHLTKQVCIYKV